MARRHPRRGLRAARASRVGQRLLAGAMIARERMPSLDLARDRGSGPQCAADAAPALLRRLAAARVARQGASARAASTRTSARRCRSTRRSRYCERLYRERGLAGAVPHDAVRAPRDLDDVLARARLRRVRPARSCRSAPLARAAGSAGVRRRRRRRRRRSTQFADAVGRAARVDAEQRDAHYERLGNTPQRTRALVAQRRWPHRRRRASVMLEDGLAGVFSMATTAGHARPRRRDARSSRALLAWAWEHGARTRTCRSMRRQRAGARRLPQVRLRDRVHVPLLRAAGRMRDDATPRIARSRGARRARSRARECASASTAESCTGGLVAGAITDIAGQLGWFERGFVTYSNEAKIEMLGVPPATLDAHGAVSRSRPRARWPKARCAQPRAARGGRHRHRRAGRRQRRKAGRHGLLRAGPARGVPHGGAPRALPGDRAAVRRAAVVAALEGLLGIGCGDLTDDRYGRAIGRRIRPFGRLASNDRSMP